MTGTDRKIIWLIAAAVLARLIFASLFPPLLFRDSRDYLELAGMIRNWDFSGYTGARTPVYPLLILLFDSSPGPLLVGQFFMGLLICLVLYLIFRDIFGSEKYGFIAGLGYALNPSQLAFERAILTETFLVLVIAGSFLVFIRLLKNGASLRPCLLLGVLSSLAALTKPLYLFLPPLYAVLLTGCFLFRKERNPRAAALRFVCVIFPAVIFLGGWSLFNYAKTGYLGVTTLAGLNLSNHTGAFIEDAPEKYGRIKEIYLKYRKDALQNTGTASQTIWLALDELERSTGMSFAELSGQFGEMSLDLIAAHPGRYLASVAKSAVIFWLPTWYAEKGGFLARIRSGGPAEKALLYCFGACHVICGLIFTGFLAAWLLSGRLRRVTGFNCFIFSIYALVLSNAVLQALMEFGENARYKQPVEPFIIGLALCLIIAWRDRVRGAGEGR